jgi:phospholipid/cholesterol/gamma-HCH transport system substrate-binding protein
VGHKLNRLFNMAAHNPGGAEPTGDPGRDEGYLYWVSWLGHNTSNLFSSGDGNGFYRRVYLTMGCEHAHSLVEDANPVTEQLRRLVTGLSDPLLDELCNE